MFGTYLIVVYMSGSAPATILGFVARSVGLHSAIVGYTIVVASLAFVDPRCSAYRRAPPRAGRAADEAPVVSLP